MFKFFCGGRGGEADRAVTTSPFASPSFSLTFVSKVCFDVACVCFLLSCELDKSFQIIRNR